MSEHKITVQFVPKIMILRTIFVTSLEVGVIGIGIAAESEAMQWIGFISILLIGVSIAMDAAKKSDSLTIAEARARLDEVERKGDLL